MADNFGVYNITGGVELVASSSLDSALAYPSGNFNERRFSQRHSRDLQEISTVRSSSTNFMNVFVVPELSSSQHEVTSVNSFRSGTVRLETTAVPASGTLYYSKQNRFVKRTYYLTASAGMQVLPVTQERAPSTDEYAARATFLSVSGSYRNTSIFNPSIFEFQVPDHGKIRDVKIWLEFIHDHRGGPGTGSYGGNHFLAGGSGSSVVYKKQGLQGVQVSLRSPNVSFDYAHPLWNDKTVRNFEKWPDTGVNPRYRAVPELLKNSYLLWAGHSCEEDLGYAIGVNTGSVIEGEYTTRILSGSSFGAGISGSLGDSDDFYRIQTVNPAYRTLSAITMHTDRVEEIGVMFPELIASNRQAMTFLLDRNRTSGSAIDVEPFPVDRVLWFHTSSYVDGGFNKFNSPRVRAQENSGLMHAACLGASPGNATEIRYGIRKVGDPNAFPWRNKFPIVTSGNVLSFPPGLAGDAFMDFALDSRGKPHFVMQQWNGSIGMSELAYSFFSGQTPVYDNVPTGATFHTNAGDSTYPKKYDYYQRAAYGDDLFPDFTIGILDSAVLDNTLGSPPGSVGPYCKIEIDSSDMIHVVYVDTTNRALKYAKKQVAYAQWSGSWSFEFVKIHDISTFWPTYVSMDIDSQNRPHVAWTIFNGTDYEIYYGLSGSSGWSIEKVVTHAGFEIGTNLKLDHSEVPTIVSTNTNVDGNGIAGVLVYKSSSEVGWTEKLVYRNTRDDPRDTALVFSDPNLLSPTSNNFFRIYTGGNRLTGNWQGFNPSHGRYFEYDTDIDMRTVFTDSSRYTNPRNLTQLYRGTTELTPGVSTLPGMLMLDEHSYASPFSASIRLLQTAGVWGATAALTFRPTNSQNTQLSGANCPWMFDSRVPPGIFHGLNYFSTITSSLGLSPPPGWLTGPGGTANVNEFPTNGANLGPADIQPVYPILDDVYVEKIYDQPNPTNPRALPFERNRIIGFRPGLRGTEINGTWRLMLGIAGDTFTGDVTGSVRAGVWFRQARLEFLVDEGEPSRDTYPSKSFRFKKHGIPKKEANKRVAIMSGSSAWDVGVNFVFVNSNPEYGRSVGITDQSGSSQFAVFSQLTGAFVDVLSGSGDLAGVRLAYLTNEFGTPYIPLSSGSGLAPSFDTFDNSESKISREIFSETLNPTTLISRDNTLRAHMARADVLKTTRDTILIKTSS